tara:strand:+ start:331 stop:615 length:285 start_codon:yes stop_codon:yes gene_type:complete
MNENLTSIIITFLTLLFSGGAWKFYEFKIKNKRSLKKEETAYRDDLKIRVEKLEKLKESCNASLLQISTEMAGLKVRLDFIEKENQILKIKLQI